MKTLNKEIQIFMVLHEYYLLIDQIEVKSERKIKLADFIDNIALS